VREKLKEFVEDAAMIAVWCVFLMGVLCIVAMVFCALEDGCV
jgi:hypothetical protein